MSVTQLKSHGPYAGFGYNLYWSGIIVVKTLLNISTVFSLFCFPEFICDIFIKHVEKNVGIDSVSHTKEQLFVYFNCTEVNRNCIHLLGYSIRTPYLSDGICYFVQTLNFPIEKTYFQKTHSSLTSGKLLSYWPWNKGGS